MHKALYREYRPLSFDEVVGQDYIIKTLKNQIKNGSLSHAYLFCGTRGTGKTTTAKILSRAVNCIGEGDKPCNSCEICSSILEGSNLDVVEIDAASNNSVDDIRELRDKVKYTPNISKYRVYIIDEVHMLTQGAFNALLKTLEEPPPFVIFILATTEPNKIPATILSRCQRFDFKRVDISTLVSKMKEICDKEGVLVDDDALRIVARNGQGSVRDSLSILDKCVSFGEKELTSKDVLDILGSSDLEHLFSFANSILKLDVCSCIKMIDDYFMWGKDLSILVQDTTLFFRSLMMAKVFSNIDDILDYSREDAEKILELSKGVSTEEIIRILSTLSELSSNIKYSSNPKMAFEIYIMKLATPETDDSKEALMARIEKLEKLVEDEKIQIKPVYVQGMSINQGASPVDMSQQIAGHVGMNHNMMGQDSMYPNAVSYSGNPIMNQQLMGGNHNLIDGGTEVYGVPNDEDLLSVGEANAELGLIKNRWNVFLEQLVSDKKVPLKVFLSEVVEFNYSDHKLIIVLSDGYTFAIDRLNEEKNKSYIESTLTKIMGFKIVPMFTVVSKYSDGNLNMDKAGEAEDFLKNALGSHLEIK